MSDMDPTASGYQKKEPDPFQTRAMRIMSRRRRRKEKLFDNLADVIAVIDHLRSMGCVIVLVMGTWDMIHEGHAGYLEKAKESTEDLYPEAEQVILLAAVDSDKLTRERKGDNRPVVGETERCAMISHLESVDIVVLEHQLAYLHTQVPHDVRVISTSTRDLEVDENVTRYCEKVINLPPQAETSTSARIRLLFVEGGNEVLGRFRLGVEALLKEVEDGFKV